MTNVKNIVQETEEQQSDWPGQIERMGNTRLPQQALKYKQTGRRDRGETENKM
jgi:hypothetical protein